MVISSGGQGAFQDQAYLDKVIEDDKKKWEAMQRKKEKENKSKRAKGSRAPTTMKRSSSIPGSKATAADVPESKVRHYESRFDVSTCHSSIVSF